MFSRILVPLDGSQLSEQALPHAIHLAAINNSQLVLAQVLEPEMVHGSNKLMDPLTWQLQKAEAGLYLDTLVSQTREKYPLVEHHVLEGRTPDTIVKFAQGNAVDLLVMSSHGQGGLSPWNLSSVIQKVISKVYLPVLIVRAYQPIPEGEALQYKHILLPFDCSKRAECSLSAAIAIAGADDARILLATALRKPDIPLSTSYSGELNDLADQFMALSRKAVEAYLEDVSRRIPAATETRVVEGPSISRAIHQLADEEDVDLVILCAHGHTGQAEWPYGTVAENYILHGTHPVLIMQDVPPSLAPHSQAEIAAEKYGSRG